MKAQQSRNNHATMKKAKKITDIHDYSKEVDKIIATKKPIVEQFMELMKLMDVTFIETKLGARNNLVTSSKKHDKSVQDKQTSDCCGAEVISVQGYPKDEGTHYWQCSKCGRPCDIMSQSGSQTKRKRDATTGSTAAVHLLDENQTSNRRLNKQDKSVQDKQTTEKSSAVENNRIKKKRKSSQNEVSDCCGAKVLSVQGYPKDEGTHYWQCSKCGAPCNIMSQSGSQTKRKRDATTGSTAAVHLDWRDKYLDKFGTTPHKGIEEFITQLLSTQRKQRIKKRRKSYQNDVFGIGGKVDRFFLSGDDITLYKINRFIRKIFLDILKHNQDPMTGLYDYDGIAQEVIDLVKK